MPALYMRRWYIGNENTIWICDDCDEHTHLPHNPIDSGTDPYEDRTCDRCGRATEDDEPMDEPNEQDWIAVCAVIDAEDAARG